jgi:peptide/nickel transport system permease protein
MIRFIAIRVWQSIIVLFIVTLMVFLTLQAMPGDPVALFLGENASSEQIAHYTKVFGLDQPPEVQYYKWISGIFTGEMGRSITYQRDVKGLLAERIPVTLSVTVPALVLASILGTTLGVIAAVKRGSGVDTLITSIANLGVATPNFWLAILGVYIFALKLRWVPVMGYTPLSVDFVAGVKKLILPVLILALGPTVSFTRQTRSAVLEVIRQDYIRTARSKGLRESVVIYRHVLRNAFIPILTLMGFAVGGLLGGTIIIEQIFVLPGMGTLLLTAITNKDFMVVQNIVFIVAVIIMASNLVVDILYGYVDPRIRIE